MASLCSCEQVYPDYTPRLHKTWPQLENNFSSIDHPKYRTPNLKQSFNYFLWVNIRLNNYRWSERRLHKFSPFLDRTCSKQQFACINGERCIDKQLVCDGHFDCQGTWCCLVYRNIKSLSWVWNFDWPQYNKEIIVLGCCAKLNLVVFYLIELTDLDPIQCKGILLLVNSYRRKSGQVLQSKNRTGWINVV